MQYKDWAPTCFDSKGSFLYDERQDWYVMPVSQTRDSEALSVSNFHAAQEILKDQDVEFEVHRFGHWGPGWIEIIITPNEEIADEIQSSLEDYPVLDDSDLSEREWESKCKTWEFLDTEDRVKLCQKSGVSIFAARHDELPSGVDQYIEA